MNLKRRFLIPRALGLLPLMPLCASLLLLSCSSGAHGVATDCVWDGEASAWLDKNRNGIWENDEPPLAGVRFLIDDTWNHYTSVGKEAVSDGGGKASLGVWLPGCPKIEFEIYAQPPDGYLATTQARVQAHGTNSFAFGFVTDK